MNLRFLVILLILILGMRIARASNERTDLIFRNCPVINSSDSIIFDLANATLTATYIDIPVYILSNDVINSYDYAMQFNLNKLTYSAYFDLLPGNTVIMSNAYFNTSDLYVRYTSSSPQSYPSSGNVYTTKIRFNLSASCISISNSDFYNVLAILNGTQCSSRMTALSPASYKPVANFGTSPTCINSLIQFSDSTKITNGKIKTWAWNLGNGITSTLQNNLTTYTNSGVFTATLIVTTEALCKDTLVKTFTVSAIPLSNFTFTFDCSKDTVFFTNTSSVSTGSITGSQWFFGDNTGSSTLKDPSYHFNTSGNVKVKLISISDVGCRSTIIKAVSIRPSDINKDGITDVDDFLIFAPAFNTSCD